jgi:hypothetical protein
MLITRAMMAPRRGGFDPLVAFTTAEEERPVSLLELMNQVVAKQYFVQCSVVGAVITIGDGELLVWLCSLALADSIYGLLHHWNITRIG